MDDFSSVGEFHRKFGLGTTGDGPPRPLTAGEAEFRFGFMLEELAEIAEGMGLAFRAEWAGPSGVARGVRVEPTNLSPADFGRRMDLVKVADGLVDLGYVVLGTAQLARLPWARLFAEVHRANMGKERCGIDHSHEGPVAAECATCGKSEAEHSKRGSALDVIKPPGWKAPEVAAALLDAGWPGPPLPMWPEKEEQ